MRSTQKKARELERSLALWIARCKKNLEIQLETQRHRANAAAEEGRRVQEIRIGAENVPLSGGGRGNAQNAEYVAVAQGIVLVIKNVEDVDLCLEKGALRKVEVLASREIEDAKTGRREAIAAHIGEAKFWNFTS